jgi:hypothetical protein
MKETLFPRVPLKVSINANAIIVSGKRTTTDHLLENVWMIHLRRGSKRHRNVTELTDIELRSTPSKITINVIAHATHNREAASLVATTK